MTIYRARGVHFIGKYACSIIDGYRALANKYLVNGVPDFIRQLRD